MKNSYYFDHDYNSRNDQKILIIRAKYGAKGYGTFWMLIEMMAESTMPHLNLDHIPAIAVAINEDPDWLKEFIEYCIEEAHLFICDGISFANHRLIRHKIFRESFSEYGEKGANKRWGKNSLPNTPLNSPPNAKESKVKESKGKEIKEIKDFVFLLDPVFKDIFEAYLKNRKTKATDRAKELILKDLHKHSKEIAIAMLEQSIKNGWIGIFELKEDKNGASKGNSRISDGKFEGVGTEYKA